MRYFEILTEAVSVDSPAFRNWFAGSKVVDAAGNPLPVYHGTKRPDRVGTQFRKDRATAGPMAYFTDDPEIASTYASAKADTSIGKEQADYANWFKVVIPNYRGEVPIGRAWYSLSGADQKRMAELAPQVSTDEDDNIHIDPENTTGNGGYTDYTLRQNRGNVLAALLDAWVLSGALFGQEKDFLKVLKAAGMPFPVRLDDPNAEYPFVYQVFLCIRNPLISTSIPADVIKSLEKASVRQRTKPSSGGYHWDKKTTDARVWFRDLLNDIEKTGGTMSWTVVPDWVTKTLQAFGYDGIHDVGGKNGGRAHSVWIPFDDRQVKSAISNRKFDPMKKNIHQ